MDGGRDRGKKRAKREMEAALEENAPVPLRSEKSPEGGDDPGLLSPLVTSQPSRQRSGYEPEMPSSSLHSSLFWV